MAVLPIVASADTFSANASKGVVISASGIVNVVGANVTAVGSGFINAATALGTTVINWIVNTSATTKIEANGSANASTTSINVGDKVSFMGTLSSVGSSITVAASRVRDTTTFPKPNSAVGKITGKVASVNTANGSFVLTVGNHPVTVQTNSSTTVSIDGTTSTLSSLQAGEQVKVTGTTNAGGSIITASQVSAKSDVEKADKENGDDSQKDKGESSDDNHGKSFGNKSSAGLFANILARFHFGKKD